MTALPAITRAELGFLRVAVASPSVVLAEPAANASAVSAMLEQAAAEGVSLVVFPELCLTGYSCGDLFAQASLLAAAQAALADVAAATAVHDVAAIVGLPIADGGRLYNCAVLLADGRPIGIVPKSHLPNYGEFYEQRWFASGIDVSDRTIALLGAAVPFGSDLLFAASNMPAAVFGVEICEDLWAPVQPSAMMALAGATLLANLSASDEVLSKAAYRRDLVVGQSGRCLAAYLYAAAGPGESSADVVYSGASQIAENNTLLAEAERFSFAGTLTVADIDLQRLEHERLTNSTFAGAKAGRDFRRVEFRLPRTDALLAGLARPLSATPFVPLSADQRQAACEEILDITATALARRLRSTHSKVVTLGLSGGLDSTLALLIICRAIDTLGLPRSMIRAISMPGPGTGERTRANAAALAAAFGTGFEEIPLGAALEAHLAAIGQPDGIHDVAYENAQARERTQILMDRANQLGGFMVGTSDLSELALGWCTYGGDHMSNYAVLAGIPKTLVRYLIAYAAEQEGATAQVVLTDIGATPISPELLPAMAQETESLLGPYPLHDFFLYHMLRTGAGPRRLAYLAALVFDYDMPLILATLRMFIARFFGAQFKRDALPDGPKVGTVALSQRGDWRMPSDARPATWLKELDDLEQAMSTASPEETKEEQAR